MIPAKLLCNMVTVENIKVIHTSTGDTCMFLHNPEYPADRRPYVVIQDSVYKQIQDAVATDNTIADIYSSVYIPPVPLNFDNDLMIHYKRVLREQKGEDISDSKGIYNLVACIYELHFKDSTYFGLTPVVAYKDKGSSEQLYIRPLSEMFEVVHVEGYTLPRFCQA